MPSAQCIRIIFFLYCYDECGDINHSKMSLRRAVPCAASASASLQGTQLQDKDFVKKWATSVILNKSQKQNYKKRSSTSQLKKLIVEVQEKCKSIKEAESSLRDNASSLPSEAWDAQVAAVKAMVADITLKQDVLDYAALLEVAIKSKEKIYRKRRQEKNKKRAYREGKTTLDKSKQIDEWLNKMKGELRLREMENEHKKETDLVLRDVTKYKTEARRSIALLEHLLKLRNAKEKSARGMGGAVNAAEEAAFTNNIEKLIALWTSALLKYNDEEAQLRQSLLCKQDAATVRPATPADSSAAAAPWRLALFGQDAAPQRDFSGDLPAFITMRRKWDMFLDEGGDSYKLLPAGWVTPPAAEQSWKHYLAP